MSSEIEKRSNAPAGQNNSTVKISGVKEYLANPAVIKRTHDLLGRRADQFMTSVSSMVSADDKLAKSEPVSLFMAALTAAALDLPVNKNLGFAHIVPYENNRAGVTEAQFQMGWKGYVQLAQRSGLYKTINVTEVKEGEIKTRDRLSGDMTFDWIDNDKDRTNEDTAGYVAYFKLTTGFEKTLFMSLEEVTDHAKKFSKAYAYDLKPTTKYKNSPWSTNFDAMAKKTLIKQIISKWGPMSVDMQKAIISDQAVIREDETPEYIDGKDLVDDEKASEDTKNAILEANTNKKTGEIKDEE